MVKVPDMPNAARQFLYLIFILVIGAIILGAVPSTPYTAQLSGSYLFVVQVFLDWGTPNINVLLARLLIGVGVVGAIYYKYQNP